MMIVDVVVVYAVAVDFVVAVANAVELPIFWERRTQQEAHELGHNRHQKTEY